MLFAATELNMGSILFQIFAILVAAKVAAELAERVGIPAVLGEIVAGVLIGPSVLGLVKESDTLVVLAELGVILLLLQVGMEMDLAELGKVGKASLLVAVMGVVAPFAMGAGAGIALGKDAKTAVFLGAALTATSVGITARVFGDLRALATTEARIVLGAAVADDVLGLVILTVVARVVEGGSVSAGTVLGVIGLAVGFLLLTGVVGLRLAPALFRLITRFSKSGATLTALALAFALGFSTLANSAKLAPIIGAFMAGLAITKSEHSHRIERELRPVGHIFIPVFFLQIGIDTDIGAFAKPSVLGIAAVLTVIGVVGKIVAAVGARGTVSDKLLIGFGMIPRGEVGLIFATLGLRTGVLDDDLYAALILVVLVTTVMTPPLLRMRIEGAAGSAGTDDDVTPRPDSGWLTVERDEIVLHGRPPIDEALPIAFEAAVLATTARPGEALLQWFAARRNETLRWEIPDTTEALFDLLENGSARSWRLLETLGVLDRALPEAAATIDARRQDPSEPDPTRVLSWRSLERIRELSSPQGPDHEFETQFRRLEHPRRLFLAAFVVEALAESVSDRTAAAGLVGRLRLTDATEEDVAFLVSNANQLRAAVRRNEPLDEHEVFALVTHLGDEDRARALYLLTIATSELSPWQRAALDELYATVVEGLAHPEITGQQAGTMAEARLVAAKRLCETPATRERLEHAPRTFLLSHSPEELARQAQLIEPLPRPGTVRIAVSPNGEPGRWKIDVATRDRKALLAHLTDGLTEAGLDIVTAGIATWGDGAVLDSFTVASEFRPSAREVAERLEEALRQPLRANPVVDVELDVDDDALPWHTLVTVTGPDGPGRLRDLTAAFADAGVIVHSARVSTVDGSVNDRFALTDRFGRKLDEKTIAAVRRSLASGGSRRRFALT